MANKKTKKDATALNFLKPGSEGWGGGKAKSGKVFQENEKE